jgi:hypothetical protein
MGIKDYISKKRKDFNNKVNEIGNEIYSGLGDALTTEFNKKGLGALALAGSIFAGSGSVSAKNEDFSRFTGFIGLSSFKSELSEIDDYYASLPFLIGLNYGGTMRITSEDYFLRKKHAWEVVSQGSFFSESGEYGSKWKQKNVDLGVRYCTRGVNSEKVWLGGGISRIIMDKTVANKSFRDSGRGAYVEGGGIFKDDFFANFKYEFVETDKLNTNVGGLSLTVGFVFQ